MGSASCMCALAGGERRVSFLSFSNLKKWFLTSPEVCWGNRFSFALLSSKLVFLYIRLHFYGSLCMPVYNPPLRTPSSNEQHMERMEEKLQYMLKKKNMAIKQRELAEKLKYQFEVLQMR